MNKPYIATSHAIAALCAAMLQHSAFAADELVETEWPFIVIRHDMGVNDAPDVFARLMECHGRNPASECAILMNTKGNATRPLAVIPCASPNERVVVIDNIPGWQICTIFLE